MHGAPGHGTPGARPGMVSRVRGSEFRSQHGESEGGTEKGLQTREEAAAPPGGTSETTSQVSAGSKSRAAAKKLIQRRLAAGSTLEEIGHQLVKIRLPLGQE